MVGKNKSFTFLIISILTLSFFSILQVSDLKAWDDWQYCDGSDSYCKEKCCSPEKLDAGTCEAACCNVDDEDGGDVCDCDGKCDFNTCTEGSWTDTGDTRCSGDIIEKEQSKTLCPSGTSTQWVTVTTCSGDQYCSEESGTPQCVDYCGDGVLDSGEDCDPGIAPGETGYSQYCQDDCTIPTCGNTLLDPDEECDIDSDSEGIGEWCGGYFSGCNACICSYFPAALTFGFDHTDTCMTDEDRSITVYGTNTYCGDIRIIIDELDIDYLIEGSDGEGVDYEYTFTIPLDFSSEFLDVVAEGARIEHHSEFDDSDTSVCSQTLSIPITYKGFYYCPDTEETEDTYPGYNTYEGISEYYTFNARGLPTDWDDCVSDTETYACTESITNCILPGGDPAYNMEPKDTDSDDEIEVCYSIDDKMGGWLDADSKEELCNAVAEFPNTASLWMIPSNLDNIEDARYVYVIDDFDDDITTGACCGDDYGENVKYAAVYEGGTVVDIYKGCCPAGDSCVDSSGICREDGYSQCYEAGREVVCEEGAWGMQDNPDCRDKCDACNINNDGELNDGDLAIIQNCIDGKTEGCQDDPAYDTNSDGTVDEDDYAYCADDVPMVCNVCGDGIVQDFEECDYVGGVAEYNDLLAPESTCAAGFRNFPDDNHLFFERTGCREESCKADYSSSCGNADCGSECSVDADCSDVIEEFCFEQGLKSNGLSDYVTKTSGSADFSWLSKDSWCCEQQGEYYAKSGGWVEIDPSITQGEYNMMFGYRVDPRATDASLRIECGTRTMTVPGSVLKEYMSEQGYAWFPGMICDFTALKNKVIFKSEGSDNIYLAGMRLQRTGATCDTTSCGCIDVSYCGNEELDSGETCDESAGITCPTAEDCTTTVDPSRIGVLVGSKEYCDARCVYVEKTCGVSDGACPSGCFDDPDCAGWVPR